jgi:hypothetical protein
MSLSGWPFNFRENFQHIFDQVRIGGQWVLWVDGSHDVVRLGAPILNTPGSGMSNGKL